MQLSDSPRIHPLIAAAATSVILVCMAGVAVLVYMLPFGKDSGAGMLSLLSRQSPPAVVVVQQPGGIGVPAGAGGVAGVATASPATPPAPALQGLPGPSVTTEPVATARGVAQALNLPTTTPAVGASETAALKTPLPVESAQTTASTQPAHAVVRQKQKGLSPAQLDAARRATSALASGQGASSTPEDSAPAKLRPEQLEEARRATALLAQAAASDADRERTTSATSPASATSATSPASPTSTNAANIANDAPARMSAERLQAERELEAGTARVNGMSAATRRPPTELQ